MTRGQVYVEIDAAGQILRILKRKSEAWQIPPACLQMVPKSYAVSEIRRGVFNRSRGECEWCAAPITWITFEMHEDQQKSLGGEVSMENSKAICHGCHQGRADSAHGNRRWGGRTSPPLY